MKFPQGSSIVMQVPSTNTPTRILILGGYGNFGRRVATLLAKDPSWHILIAGRGLAKCQQQVAAIQMLYPDATLTPFAIDWSSPNFAHELKASQAQIVIHTAGPFQQQDYQVAKACIDAGIHYIDLSDGRDFVTGITELDERAKAAQVAVISGASSVPGLSSVVIDTYAKRFGMLREIYYGIVPGNQVERGTGTIAAILSYTGKPFQRLEKGRWRTVYGWQDLHQHYYSDTVGKRWHANIDIPDLALFPERYPDVKSVVFHAGLELSSLHFMMWIMSGLARMKLVPNWKAFAKPITAISRWFARKGTDVSAMQIRMTGSNLRFQPLEVIWTLVAESGHGLYVPAVASVLVAQQIRQGKIQAGAMPCLGMFSLEEFDDALAGLNIYHVIEEKEM